MSNRILERHEFADGAELAQNFADWSANILRNAIAARGVALLAVSGGVTPLRYFLALSKRDLDWSRVAVTLVDERRVPEDHPRSNARLVRTGLLQNAAAAATFTPLADARLTPEQELLQAQTRIAQLPLPADLVVLGMGEDGHTASWFPGAAGVREAIDPGARALVAPITPPGQTETRLTLTGRIVLRARRIALQMEGPGKLAAFERALEDGPTDEMPIRAPLRMAADRLAIFQSAVA